MGPTQGGPMQESRCEERAVPREVIQGNRPERGRSKGRRSKEGPIRGGLYEEVNPRADPRRPIREGRPECPERSGMSRVDRAK